MAQTFPRNVKHLQKHLGKKTSKCIAWSTKEKINFFKFILTILEQKLHVYPKKDAFWN